MTEDLEGYAQVPPQFPEVRILRLRPGDVLLLHLPQDIDDMEIDAVMKDMAKAFPGHSCVALDERFGLDVLRKEGD